MTGSPRTEANIGPPKYALNSVRQTFMYCTCINMPMCYMFVTMSMIEILVKIRHGLNVDIINFFLQKNFKIY